MFGKTASPACVKDEMSKILFLFRFYSFPPPISPYFPPIFFSFFLFTSLLSSISPPHPPPLIHSHSSPPPPASCCGRGGAPPRSWRRPQELPRLGPRRRPRRRAARSTMVGDGGGRVELPARPWRWPRGAPQQGLRRRSCRRCAWISLAAGPLYAAPPPAGRLAPPRRRKSFDPRLAAGSPSSAYAPPQPRGSPEGKGGKRPGEAGEVALLQLCPGQTALESRFSGRFPDEAVLGSPLAQLRSKQLPKLLGKLCQTDPDYSNC
jgi:hypothetical protein